MVWGPLPFTHQRRVNANSSFPQIKVFQLVYLKASPKSPTDQMLKYLPPITHMMHNVTTIILFFFFSSNRSFLQYWITYILIICVHFRHWYPRSWEEVWWSVIVHNRVTYQHRQHQHRRQQSCCYHQYHPFFFFSFLFPSPDKMSFSWFNIRKVLRFSLPALLISSSRFLPFYPARRKRFLGGLIIHNFISRMRMIKSADDVFALGKKDTEHTKKVWKVRCFIYLFIFFFRTRHEAHF